MATVLKQSTQIKVRIGPFVDVTDGFTPETGVALSTADEAELLKADGAATVDISAATWAAVTGADGWYDLTLTTSHTDTVGELVVVVHDDSVCLPVFARFQVIEEATYDAIFAASATGFDANGRVDVGSWLGTAVTTSSTTSKPEVDVNSISDDAGAANNCEAFFDGTGYAGTGNTIPTVTTLTGHTAQTGDSFARLGAPAGVSVSADVAAVKTDTAAILVDTGTTLETHLTDIKGGTFSGATDSLEAIRDRGDAAWTTGSGTGLTALATGTAQAGAASTITLASGASATDNLYRGLTVKLTGGTGAGQARPITAYTGSSKVATVSPSWTTNPDATSTYELVEGFSYPSVFWASSITSTAIASNAITSAKIATDAIGAAQLASDAVNEIADQVWEETQSSHVSAGTFGEIATEIASILVDTGTTLDGKIDTIDTNVDAVLVDTGTTLPGLIGTPANLGTAATLADNFRDISGGTFNAATDSLEDIRDKLPTLLEGLNINAFGQVDANLQAIDDSAITETSAGRIAGNFNTFFDNADAATTQTVDDVGAGAGGSFWSTTEQNHIRHRLGIDGTTAAPSTNTPNLGTIDANIVAVVDTGVSGVSDFHADISGVSTFDHLTDTVLLSVNDANNIAAIKAKTDLISAGSVTVTAPVSDDLAITLVRGDDYANADSRALQWSSSNWPDLTGSTIALSIHNRRTGATDISGTAGSIVSAGGDPQIVIVELTTAQTASLTLGGDAYDYDVQATLSGGNIVTLATGTVTVTRDVT